MAKEGEAAEYVQRAFVFAGVESPTESASLRRLRESVALYTDLSALRDALSACRISPQAATRLPNRGLFVTRRRTGRYRFASPLGQGVPSAPSEAPQLGSKALPRLHEVTRCHPMQTVHMHRDMGSDCGYPPITT